MMQSRLSAFLGSVAGIALVVIALWGLGQAGDLADKTGRPEVAVWAVRCAALAAFAAAQVLGLTFVVELFYNRDRFGELCRLAAGFVSTAALVGAIALGMISK